MDEKQPDWSAFYGPLDPAGRLERLHAEWYGPSPAPFRKSEMLIGYDHEGKPCRVHLVRNEARTYTEQEILAELGPAD